MESGCIKKRILFVNESLACAGGEKSLLNLLKALDYDKYEVDLQLFRYGCPWDKYIDDRVNVLPPLPYTEFSKKSLSKAIFFAFRHAKFRWLIARLKFSFNLRFKGPLYNIGKSCIYWKCLSKCYDKIKDNYDYVIAYAQGIPTFYVADKANANSRKITWINVTYTPDGEFKNFIEQKYSKIDCINAVTEDLKDIEAKHWPSIKEKLVVFRDLINPVTITQLASEQITIKKTPKVLTLVTLGRLTAQKGYDITIEAAYDLKSRGVNFIWYILGVGPLEKTLKKLVVESGLDANIKFLGVKDNPYPYLKLADIYVQTSKHEGFGIAIAEARILNIPVVATRFNTVFMQMINEKNGLVVDLDGKSVADAIIRLHEDKKLYSEIVDYLKNEPKGNLENIPQFYDILMGAQKNRIAIDCNRQE